MVLEKIQETSHDSPKTVREKRPLLTSKLEGVGELDKAGPQTRREMLGRRLNVH